MTMWEGAVFRGAGSSTEWERNEFTPCPPQKTWVGVRAVCMRKK